MTLSKFKERIWASLAHVPTITLIWISYLAYRCFTDRIFVEKITQFSCTNIQSPPITPIMLTLIGLPISLTIMRLKKKSNFIRNNAQQAYFFNIWLLQRYALLFVISFIGIYFSFTSLLIASSVLGVIISLICIQQSIAGIVTALSGRVYHYWYLFKKN